MRFKKVHYLRVSKSFQFQRIINAEILTKMAKDLGAMSRKDRTFESSNWWSLGESGRLKVVTSHDRPLFDRAFHFLWDAIKSRNDFSIDFKVDVWQPFYHQETKKERCAIERTKKYKDCPVGCLSDPIGASYKGNASVTSVRIGGVRLGSSENVTVQIGYVCQRWDMNYPTRTGQNDALPAENDRDHNFCRNPDNDPNGPWCYAFSKSWGKVKLLRVTRNAESLFRHTVIFHSVLEFNQIIKCVQCKHQRKCLKCKQVIPPLNYKQHYLGETIKCNQISGLCRLIFQ